MLHRGGHITEHIGQRRVGTPGRCRHSPRVGGFNGECMYVITHAGALCRSLHCCVDHSAMHSTQSRLCPLELGAVNVECSKRTSMRMPCPLLSLSFASFQLLHGRAVISR